MNYFSDALTIGFVLVLLFGSIALYLYTRIQQTEQKNSLLESILLDLKMNAEIKSYSELPAEEDETEHSPLPLKDSYKSLDDVLPSVASVQEEELKEVIIEPLDVADYKSIIDDAVKEVTDVSTSYEESSYDLMTLKELQAMAKSKGISGSSGMKKNALIDALKAQDHSIPKSGGEDSISHE